MVIKSKNSYTSIWLTQNNIKNKSKYRRCAVAHETIHSHSRVVDEHAGVVRRHEVSVVSDREDWRGYLVVP